MTADGLLIGNKMLFDIRIRNDFLNNGSFKSLMSYNLTIIANFSLFSLRSKTARCFGDFYFCPKNIDVI